MKKLLSLILIISCSLILSANETTFYLTTTIGTINFRGYSNYNDDYDYRIWDINTGTSTPILIEYATELETIHQTDQLAIYSVNANGVKTAIKTCYGVASGTVSTNIPTGHAQIILRTVYGAQSSTDGFTINYSIQNACDVQNFYVCGNLGIGTTNPTAALHVNGNIRGNGLNNAITIAGTGSSTVSIGVNSEAALYNTNALEHAFMQPIRLNTGIINTSSSSNLSLQTNGTTRMTILKSNGNIGIGTTNPTAKLDVNGTIKATSLNLSSFTSEYIESRVNSADEIVAYTSINSPTIHTSTIEIEGSASGSGSLFVDGTITANEIIVENTSGADFVFDKNYQLRDLQEVKQYIQDNQHLPEIQSASEMKENGVNMTELQIKLLQKIEELTLYVIQQEETIKVLQDKVNVLSK